MLFRNKAIIFTAVTVFGFTACKHNGAGSNVSALEDIQNVAKELPMQLFFDLPQGTGEDTKTALTLVNSFTAATVYGGWTNKFLNGYGNKAINQANGAEGAVEQLLRFMSSYDLHLTSSLKRLQARGQLGDATLILLPGSDAGQLANRGFKKIDRRTRYFAPLETLFSALNPFGHIDMYRIPPGEIDYSQANFEKTGHGAVSQSGSLALMANLAFSERYQKLQDSWRSTRTKDVKLFYLMNMYSPLVIQTQIKAGENGKDSYLYTEAYFMAPGVADVSGDDPATWTLKPVDTILEGDKVMRTAFAEMNQIIYPGASLTSRDKFAILKVSSRKIITKGGWEKQDKANTIKGRITVGNWGQSAVSRERGELIKMKHSDESAAIKIAGRFHIKRPAYTGFGSGTIQKMVDKINLGLNKIRLNVKFMDLEVDLIRQGERNIKVAFEKDHTMKMKLRPKATQRLFVEIEWDANPNNMNSIQKAIVKSLEDGVGASDNDGITDSSIRCTGGICKIQVPILYFDKDLPNVGYGLHRIVKLIKDGVKGQVANEANSSIETLSEDINSQIGQMLSTALHTMESQRQGFSDQVHQNPDFLKVAKATPGS